MLYAIYGTDTGKARHKLTELLLALQKKRPDAPVIRINAENWSEGYFNEALSGVGLFAPKNIVVLDSLVASADSSESVMMRIDELSASENICIIIEEKIKAAALKKIEEKSEKVQEFNFGGGDADGGSKKEFPKTFAFADAVASKDKKKSWAIFQTLMKEGMAAEEIHGVLWWQFKSVQLARVNKSAKEAGLNPFVYRNCQTFSKKWEDAELQNMLLGLMSMYHKAHRGEVDFLSEIETLCL